MGDSEDKSPPKEEFDKSMPLLCEPRKPPPRRMTIASDEAAPSTAGWNDPPTSSPMVEKRPYKLTRRVGLNLSKPVAPPASRSPSPPDEMLLLAKNNIQTVINSLESKELLTKTMTSFDHHWELSHSGIRQFVLDVSMLLKQGNYQAAKDLNDLFASAGLFFSMLFKHILSILDEDN